MNSVTGLERVPRWAHLALGLVSLGLGLWLILRPFSSLAFLVVLIAMGLIVAGVSRLLGAEVSPPVFSRGLGVLWIAAGILVLVWPNITVGVLTLVVGIFLVVDGIGDMIAGFRASTVQRLASFILGLATLVFGILALAWPDITILVIAVVFAARLIIFGLYQSFGFFQRKAPDEKAARAPGRLRRWANVLGALIALVVAIGLALVSSQLRSGEPEVDEFYTAPANPPDMPGALLRVEPFDRGIPDNARAWRILYTTTRDEGQPAVASGIVVAPIDDSATPRPLIAWAHGTTGVDETCAPSILEGGFETGAFFALEDVIDQGWALVSTDYVGLGTEGPHPYLIGQGEARSVLDSIRAARAMDELELTDQTVVWGHSQGGHAALWTGVLAPDYAPDTDVIGVAALAPASNLTGLMEALPTVPGGGVFAAYTVSSYAEIYEDVDLDDYVAPGGQITVREMSERCLAEPAVFVSILSSLAVDFSSFTSDLNSGPLGERFVENTPPYDIEAPLLLGQGGADSLVKPEVQDEYVAEMCAAGQDVDYRVYEGLDHVPLVEADSPLIPELLEWTRARLAGEPADSTC